MNRFLQALANLFRVEELRKRVLFTLALLAVYRIGAHIPTPGINSAVLDQIFSQAAGTALGIFDLFSGGNFRRLTIFALGIMPYITSSIILLTLTTGSAFIMWLGEQISERGIGNGMSLIIFVGIVVGLPRAILDLYEKFKTGAWGVFTPLAIILLLALMVAVVAFIVLVEGGQRRIPVQYAKRVVGRRVMGGQSSYLPLRVNSGGVIPPIFASSLLAFPATIALILGQKYAFIKTFANAVKWGEPLYTLLYVTMIVLFAFFYVGIVFNPTELADNMRKNGGFIPGIRPGRNTSEYVSRILKRLTLIGAIYLALVCMLPEWMIAGIHLNHLPTWLGGNWFDRHFPQFILNGLGVNFYFGGTSLLIVVGVAMDTVQQLEAQLVMRNYEGFARKGRFRGRR